MSTTVDTELDLTVLDDLDFKPTCEWKQYCVGEEDATHVGRAHCPNCGRNATKLLGPACVTWLKRGGRVRCSQCDYTNQGRGMRVRLDPL